MIDGVKMFPGEKFPIIQVLEDDEHEMFFDVDLLVLGDICNEHRFDFEQLLAIIRDRDPQVTTIVIHGPIYRGERESISPKEKE